MAPNAHGWPTFHLDSTLIVVRCPKPVTGIRVVSRHFSHPRVPRNNAVRVVVFLNNDRASRCDIGANRQGIGQYRIDIDAVKAKMAEHQALSRAGAATKFAGGLADHAEQTVKYHTAHHLLLKALQMVLGPDVHQRGSNITSERLRIDFSYGQKMTDEQKKEVEKIVNEKIAEGIPVIRTDMKREEAEKLGAEHEFGAKYPERVSVYSVGPLNDAFSIEFCGGPHVEHTGEIAEPNAFKIIKEEAVAQGIRRIKATVE